MPTGSLRLRDRSIRLALVAAAFVAFTRGVVAHGSQDPPASPPPAAEPTPVTPAPEPAAPPAPEPPPAAAPEPTADAAPRRVHIIEDRFNEWSGTVAAEDDVTVVVTLKGSGKLRSFTKSRVLEIVPLLDGPAGQRCRVEMRNGTVYRGALVEDGYDAVVVEVEGIRQSLPRKDVARTIAELTPQELYRKARASLKPDMYQARLRLAEWLFEQKMYEECKAELVDLVEVADLFEARKLMETVDAQLRLAGPDGGSTEVPPPDAADAEERDGGPVRQSDLLPQDILSPEDVNLVRVYEIDFRDPPKVTVPTDVIRELIERYGDSKLIPATSEGRTALFREDPIKLVRLMFDLKARELYPRIEVETEPPALNLFRERVHNAWLINNCATSGCHGGVDAGRFFLHNRNHKKSQVRYTNLLILERTELPDLPPLIDWERPLDSLIVQYGLPRTEARQKHPDVKGWKPVFSSANARLLDDFEAWVKGMYRPRPEYPVDYRPPELDSIDTPEREAGDTRVPR